MLLYYKRRGIRYDLRTKIHEGKKKSICREISNPSFNGFSTRVELSLISEVQYSFVIWLRCETFLRQLHAVASRRDVSGDRNTTVHGNAPGHETSPTLDFCNPSPPREAEHLRPKDAFSSAKDRTSIPRGARSAKLPESSISGHDNSCENYDLSAGSQREESHRQ